LNRTIGIIYKRNWALKKMRIIQWRWISLNYCARRRRRDL